MAERAFRKIEAGLKDATAMALEDRLRKYLPKVSELLNIVKPDWGDDWTEWAQDIQDETIALMLAVEKDPAIRAAFEAGSSQKKDGQ